VNPNSQTASPPNESSQELGAEINRLRKLIQQATMAAEQAEEPNLDDLVRVLNAVSSASTRLATLIKTQQGLQPAESDQLAAALRQALERFHDE
jgi:flagellar hook-basal body complex protein FliE